VAHTVIFIILVLARMLEKWHIARIIKMGFKTIFWKAFIFQNGYVTFQISKISDLRVNLMSRKVMTSDSN
jgi:hypothetical protein